MKEIRNGEEPRSMMLLYEELDNIRLIPLEFKVNNEKSVKITYIVTKIDADLKELLSALGVKNAMHPKRFSFSRRNLKGDGQQMMPHLGVEQL